MDDLLGLSWNPNTTNQARPGGAAAAGHKATPPPPVKKPAHLQMGLSKDGLVPTPAASFSSSSSSSPQPQQPFRSNTLSSSTYGVTNNSTKKTADDVFGSLMPSFGGSSADLSKNLNSMSLEERRRHDQQQQQQQFMGSIGDRSSPASAASSSSGYASPALSSPSLGPSSVFPGNFNGNNNNNNNSNLRQGGMSSISNGSLATSNFASASPIPVRGYDPGRIGGAGAFSTLQPTTTSSPKSFASPSPRSQPLQPQLQPLPGMASPAGMRNQSPVVTGSNSYSSYPSGLAPAGGLGRSLSPAMTPLQPERSNNASPASMNSNSKDPFEMLLGDQVSRNSPSLNNQSLNSIRYNTPPLGQPTPTPKAAGDPWDLDFLAKATVTKDTQPANNSDDVFDLGAFEKAPPAKPVSSGRQRDSVDALHSFIGKQPSPSRTTSSGPSPPSSRGTDKPRSSPPVSSREDGDIAQIVSMGFSAERAKLALAMTENGRDIEAAVEYLIQNDEAQDQLPSRRQTTSTPSRRGDNAPPDLPARSYRDDSDPPLEDRRRCNNNGRSTTTLREQQQQELTRAQQLQQQKDKLVGSASTFGMSVLSKANEFYKQGREKVQSVMEDMSTAPEDTRVPGVRRHQWIDDEHKPSRHGQYKDSDSEDDEVFKGRREQQQQQQRQQQQQKHQDYRPRYEKETFEDTYVSSSRRGGATKPTPKNQALFSMDDSPSSSRSAGQSSASKVSSTSSSSGSRSTSARVPPSMPPKPTRPPRVLVQANGQQIATSNQFKEKGNESFKLGQFGQAAELYARASQALPSGHLLLIVTQNNRAAALLKTGEYRETVAECDRTIAWIQGPDGQGVLDTFSMSSSGTGAETGVHLKDQMGKALMRRASAYENLEKFKEATDDWARLRDLDPGHKNAVEGHRRCEKALAMVSSGSIEAKVSMSSSSVSFNNNTSMSRPAGRTASTSSPMQDLFASNKKSNQDAKARADLERSEGVSKLRQSAAQQEQEDDEKLRLTDQVDRKMAMWKSGKEDNIRALIASLGTVLWEGVGWKAVGMHELVTPQQVKIKYMRAIGKMHPDKLGASTTVEQRMMANTIFSTLNSAWDAFKVQNNM
ncbi:hypothetical protein BGZ83_010309 [Gryganskiella cystojenkinii]|nr:hypothetical protein BGZ83_010309 [Gryganskiella cystojenkinii]